MPAENSPPTWIAILDALAILCILVETVLPWFFVSEIGQTPHGHMPMAIRIVLLNLIPFIGFFLYLTARAAKIAGRLFGEAPLVSRLRRAKFYALLMIALLMVALPPALQTDPHFVYVVFVCGLILLVLAAFMVLRVVEMRRAILVKDR